MQRVFGLDPPVAFGPLTVSFTIAAGTSHACRLSWPLRASSQVISELGVSPCRRCAVGCVARAVIDAAGAGSGTWYLAGWRRAVAETSGASTAWAVSGMAPGALAGPVRRRVCLRIRHAAIATALAATLWPYLSTRGRALSAGVVAVVGLGRVYAGAHLPLDVGGGIAIGALAGMITNALLGLPQTRRQTHATASSSALGPHEPEPRSR